MRHHLWFFLSTGWTTVLKFLYKKIAIITLAQIVLARTHSLPHNIQFLWISFSRSCSVTNQSSVCLCCCSDASQMVRIRVNRDDLSLRSACCELWAAAELQDLQYTQIRLHLFNLPLKNQPQKTWTALLPLRHEREGMCDLPIGICCGGGDGWMDGF